MKVSSTNPSLGIVTASPWPEICPQFDRMNEEQILDYMRLAREKARLDEEITKSEKRKREIEEEMQTKFFLY